MSGLGLEDIGEGVDGHEVGLSACLSGPLHDQLSVRCRSVHYDPTDAVRAGV